jgi:hypothetical protein
MHEYGYSMHAIVRYIKVRLILTIYLLTVLSTSFYINFNLLLHFLHLLLTHGSNLKPLGAELGLSSCWILYGCQKYNLFFITVLLTWILYGCQKYIPSVLTILTPTILTSVYRWCSSNTHCRACCDLLVVSYNQLHRWTVNCMCPTRKLLCCSFCSCCLVWPSVVLLSCLVLPSLSCLVFGCPVPSSYLLSCPVLPFNCLSCQCQSMSCLVMSCLVLSCLVVSCLIFFCFCLA